MQKKSFSFRFAHEIAKKYTGKFVAIVNESVIATGNNRLKVFHAAEKKSSPSTKIGIFYFPTKKEMLTAL
ncbi:MAG: DUF5678 domain-containing protein [Candidatus Margulisiibacteriota bacterium]